MRLTMFIVVLTIIAVIYGMMHFYLFVKLAPLVPAHRRFLIISLIVFGLGVFAAEVMLHTRFHTFLVYPVVWFAFVWMGLVFLFFFISVVFDASGMLLQVMHAHSAAAVLASTQRTILAAVLALGVAAHGVWSARHIQVARVDLVSSKLQHPVRVVQISDLHLGLLTNKGVLEKLVATINSLTPDIIVSTGDLVDMELDHLPTLLNVVQQLKAGLGKYAVYGNHEVLAGLQASSDFIRDAGFTLLSEQVTDLGDDMRLVGVDDPMVKRVKNHSVTPEVELLRNDTDKRFVLLLKHQPVVDPKSVGQFDLQLSGHVHGGQIFPFGLLTWLVYRTPMGLSAVGKHSWLYVSRGTGTWGPPMRVLAPPEITVFDLNPGASR